jgi:hypothetical protein
VQVQNVCTFVHCNIYYKPYTVSGIEQQSKGDCYSRRLSVILHTNLIEFCRSLPNAVCILDRATSPVFFAWSHIQWLWSKILWAVASILHARYRRFRVPVAVTNRLRWAPHALCRNVITSQHSFYWWR